MIKKILNFIRINALVVSLCLIINLLIPAKALALDVVGEYYSITIGNNNIINFVSFLPIGQNKVEGKSEIYYQFAKSTDAKIWSNWSDKQTTVGAIDLTKITNSSDKFIKVKITLTSNDSAINPSLESFQVTYVFPGEGGGGGIGGPSSTGSENPLETVTETFSASELLPLTGSSLWVNLLIAAILGGLATFLILKKQKKLK